MTATTVNGKLLSPAAGQPASSQVTIALVDYNDTPVVGFNTVDDTEILATDTIIPTPAGFWTAQLVPNADIQLTDGTLQTAYRIVESGAGSTFTYWIIVAASVNPVWAGSIRTTLVGNSGGSTPNGMAIAGTLTVGGKTTLNGGLTIPTGAATGKVWTATDNAGDGAWQTPTGGGGAGTVVSVNNVAPDGTGNITLTAANVGADAAGAAAAAQSAAISAAEANAASTYLPLTGGALSGSVAMSNHKVTGIANGTVATDVAALGQVPVVGAAGSGAANALSANDATTTNARTPTAHASTHATGGSDVLTPAAIGAVATSAAGAANGVATLDSSGHLTASQAANLVDLTSSQTVAGVKAFSSSPTAPDPTASNQLATKAYADSIAQGLSVKASARVATTGALPANAYSNGASGLGATLTASANGALSVDGVALSTGDRVLVQNEATSSHNGIYTVTAAGSGASAYVLTRALDMDLAAQVPGAFVFVEAGTTNSGAGFVVAGSGPYVIGTTAIAWTQFSGAGEITAGHGLTKTGNTLALATPVAASDLPSLDQITSPAAAVSLNNKKITALANGTASTDAAAFGQVPTTATAVGAANRLTPTGVKTAAYTAQAGDLVPVDATAGSVAITLVSAPADGTVIAVKMIATASSHTTTVTCGGTDVYNKSGGATVATLSLTAQAILLQYSASSGIWYVVGDDLPLTQLDARYVAKSSPVNLTDGATIATDASLSTLYRVTLGGNRTLSNPTNGTDGQLITWSIKQDATGSRTLTLDTKFRFGTDITSITLTTTPGKTDHIGARYNSGDDKWDVIAFVRGF